MTWTPTASPTITPTPTVTPVEYCEDVLVAFQASVSSGEPVDADLFARAMLCLIEDVRGFHRAPVVVFEPTPSAANIFSAAKNLASSGNPLDMALTSWIYLESSTSSAGVLLTNGWGDDSFIQAVYGATGAGDSDCLISTDDGGLSLEGNRGADEVHLRGNPVWLGDTTAHQTTWTTAGYLTMIGDARPSKWITLSQPDFAQGAPGAASQTVGNSRVVRFDPTTDQHVIKGFILPDDYDAATDIYLVYLWAPTSTNAGTVTWGIQWHALTAETGDLLTAATTRQIVTDDSLLANAGLQAAAAIVLDGTGLAAGDWLALDVFRDADASEVGADDDYPQASDLAAVRVGYVVDRLGQDARWD